MMIMVSIAHITQAILLWCCVLAALYIGNTVGESKDSITQIERNTILIGFSMFVTLFVILLVYVAK